MKLHEMTAEQILDEIEKRSDALLEADQRAGSADADLKAWEALTAIAYKDAGQAMGEAEKRAKSGEDWCERYIKVQDLQAEAAHARRRYQSACMAQDLWRTERASMRNA